MRGATLFSSHGWMSKVSSVAWLLCAAAVSTAMPAYAAPAIGPSHDVRATLDDPINPGTDCSQNPFDPVCPITNPADPRCITRVSVVCPDDNRPPGNPGIITNPGNNIPTSPADPACISNPTGVCAGGPYDHSPTPALPTPPPPTGGEPPTGKPEPGKPEPGKPPARHSTSRRPTSRRPITRRPITRKPASFRRRWPQQRRWYLQRGRQPLEQWQHIQRRQQQPLQ